MKTTSILESIRNKINKIEKNNPAANNSGTAEPHDDFEYIDDSSKHIVDSKHNAGNYGATTSRKEPETTQATDEDFDFLSENNEEENVMQNNNIQPPKAATSQVVQDLPKTANDIALDKELGIDIDLEKDVKAPEIKVAPFNKIEDLDLENLEEEIMQPEVKPQEIKQPEIRQPEVKQPEVKKPEPKIASNNNDLDLENIDLELEDDKKIATAPQSQKIEDIDLDLDEELKEIKPAAVNVAQNNPNTNSMINDVALEDINLDLPGETPISNNYQQPMKDINIQNKTSIISDDVAKKTASTIKEMISSVPRTQNHQVLSNSAPAFKSGETIEDMVSALLAPKLEQWINENLPPMVEKIVKNEIKKLLPQDDH